MLRLDTHRQRHAGGAGGVDHVVHAAQREFDVDDMTGRDRVEVLDESIAPLDGEPERTLGRSDVDGAHVDALGLTVGDRAVAARERGRDRVVATHHLRPGDLAEVAVEAVDDAGEVAVVVEVVDLDVGQHRAVQRKFEMRAVALVGLDDEPG